MKATINKKIDSKILHKNMQVTIIKKSNKTYPYNAKMVVCTAKGIKGFFIIAENLLTLNLQ